MQRGKGITMATDYQLDISYPQNQEKTTAAPIAILPLQL